MALPEWHYPNGITRMALPEGIIRRHYPKALSEWYYPNGITRMACKEMVGVRCPGSRAERVALGTGLSEGTGVGKKPVGRGGMWV